MPAQVLKVILLGDAAVGKTSVRNRYLYDCFSNTYKATIGADFITKDLTEDNRKVVLQVWDTAGQERFHSLGTYYYRGADAVVLCYAVNSLASFEHLAKWRDEFILKAAIPDPTSFPFLLLGNKTDLTDRAVSAQQARTFCLRSCNPDMWARPRLGPSAAFASGADRSLATPLYRAAAVFSSPDDGTGELAERERLPCFETSAKDGTNVGAVFEFISRHVSIPKYTFEVDTLSLDSRKSAGRSGWRRGSCCS